MCKMTSWTLKILDETGDLMYLWAQTSQTQDSVNEQSRQHITCNEEDLPGHHAEVNVRKENPSQERGVTVGGPGIWRSALWRIGKKYSARGYWVTLLQIYNSESLFRGVQT